MDCPFFVPIYDRGESAIQYIVIYLSDIHIHRLVGNTGIAVKVGKINSDRFGIASTYCFAFL